jgi:hypothetical protein
MLLSHTQLFIDFPLSKKAELRRSDPITLFLKDTDQRQYQYQSHHKIQNTKQGAATLVASQMS